MIFGTILFIYIIGVILLTLIFKPFRSFIYFNELGFVIVAWPLLGTLYLLSLVYKIYLFNRRKNKI